LPGTPGDQVLAQSPPANASQVEAPRTSLLVTVAADLPAYVMPSFVGQPLGTASRALQDAGFKLGNVSIAPPAVNSASSEAVATLPTAPSAQSSPASVIVVQTPPAGQKVVAGTVVNFEVR
jgi:beta-lactam-binding protein with PASTA domain